MVSHRTIGAKVFRGFNIVSAKTKLEALEKAKAIWIENWNLSFPHNPNGESEVETMEFLCSI
jgi:hypothetical protein